MLDRETAPWWFALWLVVGVSLFAVALRRFTPWIVPAGRYDFPARPVRDEAPAPAALVLLAIVLTLLGAHGRSVAGDGPVGWRVVAFWLGGIAIFAFAAWLPVLARWRSRAATRDPRQVPVARIAMWGALLAIGAVPRLLWLERGPDFVNEDEGRLILMAMAARDGSMQNPFASGWLGVPQLYPALEGLVARGVGTDVAAYRTLGAILGTATVLATWRLGRRLVGEWPAYAGAVILATMPFHLRFSRSALNHVTDALVLVLSLLFLSRATRSGRRGDALLAGVALGAGWYGYWGARVFPVIAAVLLALAAADRFPGWRRALSLGMWVAIGFLATTAPLLMTYWLHPAELRGRLDATSGTSRAALSESPWEATRAILERVRDALLMPVIDNSHLFYLHEAPFLGWPVALMLIAGLGVWLARLAERQMRRPVLWLIVPWAVIAGGIALTDSPQSQRAVALAPIWALAAGTGLVAILRLVAAWMPRRARMLVPFIALALLVILGVTAFRWYMDDDRQRTTFGGDHRTLIAGDLGWRLDPGRTPDPPRVLFAGVPFMFIEDWGNLRLQAPEADLADFGTPIDTTGDVPDVPAGTVLVVIPERSGETCTIAAARPDLVVAEGRARDGTLLYTAFYRGESAPWHPGETPAGSTFTVVPGADCPP